MPHVRQYSGYLTDEVLVRSVLARKLKDGRWILLCAEVDDFHARGTLHPSRRVCKARRTNRRLCSDAGGTDFAEVLGPTGIISLARPKNCGAIVLGSGIVRQHHKLDLWKRVANARRCTLAVNCISLRKSLPSE